MTNKLVKGMFMARYLCVAIVVMMCVLCAYADDSAVGLSDQNSMPSHSQVVIQAGDRVVFVGDQMTQQMFYTRAVASAFMAINPHGNLRFFNGGKDQATAANAQSWVQELVELANPTVVILALGQNDALVAKVGDEQAQAKYQQDLKQLIDQVQRHTAIRRVVVLGTLPVLPVNGNKAELTGQNGLLRAFSRSAAQVAEQKNVVYVDLFDHMYDVMAEAEAVQGEPMTIGNNLPSELAHMVIASLVLRGVGVTAEQMDTIQWSPLRPVEMQRIRQVLALQMKPSDLESATRSRELYQSFYRYDEKFFRLWRLSRPGRPSHSRQAKLVNAEEAWAQVSQLAISLYGKHVSAQ